MKGIVIHRLRIWLKSFTQMLKELNRLHEIAKKEGRRG